MSQNFGPSGGGAPNVGVAVGTLPIAHGGTASATAADARAALGADSATNLTAGTLPDARFPATLPAASGINLTALNASNLGSGTVSDARFPATLPAASGVNLTALNATNLTSGTVPIARLSQDLSHQVEIWDDCFYALSTTLQGVLGLRGGGAGSSLSGGISDTTSFGYQTVLTAATSSADGFIWSGPFRAGIGAISYEARVKVDALSDVTNTYTLYIGISQATTAADGTDGCYFRYTHGTNSGKWVLVTRQASSETATNTNTALAADTWTRFTIVVNAGSTSVDFYINGVNVGTVTDTLPSNSVALRHHFSLKKSAGGTARTLYQDYVYLKFTPTTPR